MGDKGLRTVAAARTAIIRGPCAMQRRLGFSLYLVERKSDAAALGLCGLIKRDALPEVDIGFGMLAPFRGHGYAHEAASAVVAHAEQTLRLPRLLGIAGVNNLASNQLLQKLGFDFEKSLHLMPDDRDCNLYSLDFSLPR
jgi:RimJ/RimL family protein N-acetyltransferase